MALISCPECKAQVSTAALACPKCGAPVASAGLGTAVQAQERTSKKLKLQSLLSLVVLSVGVAIIILAHASPAGLMIGILLAALGFLWRIVTSVRIWWNHK